MWIYWVEQCKYCKQCNCDKEYKAKVNNYINKLQHLEKITTGVYGTLKFNCDYFIFDKDKYIEQNFTEYTNVWKEEVES